METHVSTHQPPADQNPGILRARVQARAALAGPRVGDWVRHPDGRETRIAYAYTSQGKDLIQDANIECGQFFLFASGCEGFSGTFNYPFPAAKLAPTSERKVGQVWFFDQGLAGVGRKVDFTIEEAVFLLED